MVEIDFDFIAGQRETPEQLLWTEVLKRALEDLNIPKHSSLSWFITPTDDPGGFIWVCEMLNIDSQRIRQKIIQAATGGDI